jgi:hypothetical protein
VTIVKPPLDLASRLISQRHYFNDRLTNLHLICS